MHAIDTLLLAHSVVVEDIKPVASPRNRNRPLRSKPFTSTTKQGGAKKNIDVDLSSSALYKGLESTESAFKVTRPKPSGISQNPTSGAFYFFLLFAFFFVCDFLH